MEFRLTSMVSLSFFFCYDFYGTLFDLSGISDFFFLWYFVGFLWYFVLFLWYVTTMTCMVFPQLPRSPG